MSKVNDLLSKVDDAFEAVEAKAAVAADVRKAAASAVAEAAAQLDAVKLQHGERVAKADGAVAEARAVLEKLRVQLNERVGHLTAVDPRVSVR